MSTKKKQPVAAVVEETAEPAKKKKDKKDKAAVAVVAAAEVEMEAEVETPKAAKKSKKEKENKESKEVAESSDEDAKKAAKESKKAAKAAAAAAAAAPAAAAAAAADSKKRKAPAAPSTPTGAAAPVTPTAAAAKDTKAKKPKLETRTPQEQRSDAAQAAAAAGEADAKGNPPISSLRVRPEIVASLAKRGITHAFPIQAKTFDMIRDGSDVIGRAKTGTGKTLAFALPIVERLLSQDAESGKPLARGRTPRVVVLAPTRELAVQVASEFENLTDKLSAACFYGGAPYYQQEATLRKGLDVCIGTCGRIDDLLTKGSLKFDNIQYVIMDEADEMLNMGFADAVEKILQSVPRGAERPPVQTCLFSATLPSWVEGVAKKYLRKGAECKRVDLVGETQSKASQDVTHVAIPCHWSERDSVLGEVIMKYAGLKGRTIIFCETKKDCNELVMNPSIKQECQALHGDISQSQREIALQGFRDGKFHCLIATDVAARGLDIPGVELVIQIEPPQSVETYIHRSGRTGRAGQTGTAITFFTPKQLFWLQQIERRGGVKFQRPGVPQKSDIIAASLQGATPQLAKVHPAVLPLFTKAADALIDARLEAMAEAAGEAADGDSKEELTPEQEAGARDRAAAEVIAQCLAVITGHTQPIKPRSLLLSAQDWVTVLCKVNQEVRSLSFFWNIIRRSLFPEPDAFVKGMRMLADNTGAVFDIPCEHEDKVTNAKPDKFFQLSIPKELPQLVTQQAERPPDRARPWQKGRSGGGGGGGGGRGGSARGGGGGGRGGGGGGRGGGGGGRGGSWRGR